MAELANRGLNLLAVTLLGLGGLEFGSVILQEHDWLDRVDDGSFLTLGLIALGWYLWRNNRFRRSVVPLLLSGLAVLVQILGLVLERDDPAAFGDNIGGMLYFVPVLVLVAVQYARVPTLARLASRR